MSAFGSVPAPARSPASGLVLAAVSAAFLGAITTLARIAYDGGSTPEAVIGTRFLVASLVLGAFLVLSGRRFALPRAAWPGVCAMALAVLGITFGYLTSVAYIPVSLAALIFYVYPLLVGLLAPLVARRRPGPALALALVLAFAGLALALGPSFQGLDPRGVAWALFGAASATALFLLGRRVLAGRDVFAVILHVNVLGGIAIGAVFAVTGGLALPATGLGWLGFAGAAVCYVVAVMTQFAALSRADPTRAALIYNLEPLVSIGLAALLLGERLAAQQLLGAALVLIALALSTRDRARN